MDNRKNVLLAVLVVGVISMTVAFAALSTRLNISGTAEVADTNWNIHFDNWALDTAGTVTYGGNTHQNTAEYPSISTLENSMSLKPNVTKVENIDVTLKQPGDYAKYTFEIVNSGTIDASLDNFDKNMTCASGKSCDFLTYEVKCYQDQTRTTTEITTSQNKDLAKNGGKAYCYLSLTYNDQTNANNSVYTQEAVTASLDAQWIWIQKQESQASEEQGGGESQETPIDGNIFSYSDNLITGYNYQYFYEEQLDFPSSIVIPRTNNGTTITGVRDGAFSSKNLTSVTINDNITSIGNGSFAGNALTSITLPSSITSLLDNAFAGNNLSSVVMNCTPNSMYEGSFSSNPNLADFTINVSDVKSSFRNYVSKLSLTNLTIGSEASSIDSSTFANLAIQNVNIQSGAVGYNAFGYSNIASLTLSNGVTTIGDNAFQGNNLTTVKIPDSVSSIGVSAFAYNPMQTVEIGTGVQTIGKSAFYDYNGTLTTIRNKLGRPFNWCEITGLQSDNCTFSTGTIGNITITN